MRQKMRPHVARWKWLCTTPPSTIGRIALQRLSTQAVGNLKILQHQHISDPAQDGIVKYDHASEVQERLRERFLHWKSVSSEKPDAADTCPPPQLITFESTPTYTLGRRQDNPSPEQTDRLCQELTVDLPHRPNAIRGRTFTPDIRKTNRGGLTTYHGPGQIVLWPVLDMRSPLYPNYSVASYAGHLESTTQRLLAELFGIKTYISPDEPGVWVTTPGNQPARKIAALGVHHRRYVTALGIALNVDIPVSGPESTNAWARFVPCGLDGKEVTSIATEVGSEKDRPWDLAVLAGTWAKFFEEGLLDAPKRLFEGLDSSLSR
ncbi:unnamed protein product [Clonostachys chloroleuca]|uniref:BPL/LPL catalytic domain-containing protein n=1 Tax=Clonostachys chloroleuca TaxID=1926264 RepID=A0AA35Q766_9HYPO|nr:unnamed protein product [Clonostachys chloroleuca]